MSKEYWTSNSAYDFVFEARAEVAFMFLRDKALIVGKQGEEDSAGRSTVVPEIPSETVRRAFELADLFIDEAERRGAIRETQHSTPVLDLS